MRDSPRAVTSDLALESKEAQLVWSQEIMAFLHATDKPSSTTLPPSNRPRPLWKAPALALSRPYHVSKSAAKMVFRTFGGVGRWESGAHVR